jgi:hypothetical protein
MSRSAPQASPSLQPDRPASSTFRFDDPRQQRISEGLTLVGPGPASFWRDACFLMANPQILTASTHVVAHLLREIDSGMRKVLEGPDPTPHGSPDAHAKSIVRGLKTLGVVETDPLAIAWLASVKTLRPTEWVHRDSLRQPRPFSEFVALWEERVTVLDALTERLRQSFLPTLDGLLLVRVPTKRTMTTFRNGVPHSPVFRRYFFERLEHWEWLESLESEGYFKDPPIPEVDTEAGTIGFAPWPESGYLSRMARIAAAQPTVLRIATNIGHSDNIRVNNDLLEVALALPPSLAVNLLPSVRQWLATPYRSFVFRPISSLVNSWASGAHANDAFILFRDFLGSLAFSDVPGSAASFEWEMRDALERCLPVLLQTDPWETLGALADILDGTQARSTPTAADESEDLSYIDRPAIEDHAQNWHDDTQSILITAVRDCGTYLIERSPDTLRPLIKYLERRRRTVFRRIALHLLREHAALAPDLVAAHLTDSSAANDIRIHHEFYLLTRDCFGTMSDSSQQTYLSIVDRGPDFEMPTDTLDNAQTAPAGDDTALQRWRLGKLHPISDGLTREWRARYDALRAEFGVSDHPDFVSYHTVGWVSEASPLSTEAIARHSVEDLARFLHGWQPTPGWRMPTREGLARRLTDAVSGSTARYASEAGVFQGLHPTFVRAIVQGFHDGVKQTTSFEWPPVLGLLRWASAQIPEEDRDGASDQGIASEWRWTRKAIAEFLARALERDAICCAESRAELWAILRSLAGDTEPTIEYENAELSRTGDPVTLSINTVRGQAFHATMQYALWVRRFVDSEDSTNRRVVRSFDAMPEVQDLLEAHLDPAKESALSIRSVYGQWLPWLVVLDKGWTARHLPCILPRDPRLAPLRNAAWDAYLLGCSPHHETFEVLFDEYRRSLQASSVVGGADSAERATMASLAEHLMVFYAHGRIALDSPDEMIQAFFSRASGKARGHAIDSVGRSLRHDEEQIPAEILGRLQALWESRCAAHMSGSVTGTEEMVAFGSWFVVKAFDLSWRLRGLRDALDLAGRVESEHQVIEELARNPSEFSFDRVACLQRMIDRSKHLWLVQASTQEIRNILSAGLLSSDSEAVKASERLVNSLAAAGHLEFRHLPDLGP